MGYSALLFSLITMPKDIYKFIVLVSFHFQCTKSLIVSTVLLQLEKIIPAVSAFKIKVIVVADFNNFSGHQNINFV